MKSFEGIREEAAEEAKLRGDCTCYRRGAEPWYDHHLGCPTYQRTIRAVRLRQETRPDRLLPAATTKEVIIQDDLTDRIYRARIRADLHLGAVRD